MFFLSLQSRHRESTGIFGAPLACHEGKLQIAVMLEYADTCGRELLPGAITIKFWRTVGFETQIAGHDTCVNEMRLMQLSSATLRAMWASAASSSISRQKHWTRNTNFSIVNLKNAQQRQKKEPGRPMRSFAPPARSCNLKIRRISDNSAMGSAYGATHLHSENIPEKGYTSMTA